MKHYGTRMRAATVHWQTLAALQFADNNEKILTVVWT